MTDNSKKIFFVTFQNVIDGKYGGAQCSQRNVNVLEKLGDVTIYSIKKKTTLHSLFSMITLHFPPISNLDKYNINRELSKVNYDIIFYDSSLFGSILKNIKKINKLKSYVFFHNVEVDYIDVRFGEKARKIFYRVLAKKSEENALKYADSIAVLNERDSNRVKELYGRLPDEVIPITFENKISKNQLLQMYSKNTNSNSKTCLFVGALSQSNLEGIEWFVNNVASNIEANILVVGTGFESQKNNLTRKNVQVIGYVEDLEKIYIESDCVISPLLSGAGMKVKIAEALMYGKSIFASSEAFEGYQIDYDKVGGICYSKDDYVNKINMFLKNHNKNKYNDYSRSVFENHYTNEVATEKFVNWFHY